MAKLELESYWKNKYDNLKYAFLTHAERIQSEVENNEYFNKISEHPISESKTLYVSNDWQTTDSLDYAKRHWGDRFQEYHLFKDFNGETV